MTRSRLRSPTSKSMATVLWPRSAIPVAMLALVVVLPTPPLPEVMTMTLACDTGPSLARRARARSSIKAALGSRGKFLTPRALSRRRQLPEYPLQAPPVQAEPARRLRNVAVTVEEDALDVLPLGPLQRRGGGLGRRLGERGRDPGRTRRGARERGQDVVGVRRLGQIPGDAELHRPRGGRDAGVPGQN